MSAAIMNSRSSDSLAETVRLCRFLLGAAEDETA